MRLLRLDLEKYGAFESRSLTFRPDARLHVVHGANEAGKSSALAAVSDLLFGFGARTDYAFRHAMADLRLGATIRAKDGREAAFRRRKGTRATLIGADEAPLDERLLDPFLGALTREVFERAFGLGAESMRKGAEELLSAEGESGASLFAAASGLRGVEDLRRAMEAEADGLFSPQARSRPFNELARRHETARKALHEAELGSSVWKKLTDEILGLEQRHRELDGLRAKARTERARLERLSRAHGAAIEVERARRQLEDFGPAPELGPGVVDALTLRLDAAEAAAQANARAAEALGAAEQAVSRIVLDAATLDAADEIEALVRESGAFAKGQADLPRLQREADALDESLGRLAGRLGLAGGPSVEAATPTDAARAAAKELIGEGQRIAQAREALAKSLAFERDRLASLEAGRGGEAAPDPRPLREALSGFAQRLAALHRRAEIAAEHERETRSIAEAAARLTPPVANLDRLATRPLPGAEALARARREQDALAADLSRLDEATARERTEIARIDAERARLVGGGPVASPEAVRAVRGARDDAWRPLRAHLLGGEQLPPAERADRVSAFELAGVEADRLADHVAEDAARAARVADLEGRLDELAANLSALVARRSDLAAKIADASEAWVSAWAGAGVVPAAPADMDGWRKDVLTLFERRERNADRGAALARLDGDEAALRPRLEVLAAEAGLDRREGLDTPALAGRLEAQLQALQDRFQEARALETQVAEARSRIVKAEQDEAVTRSEEADWDVRWATALPALGLAADASLGVAAAALDAWSEAPGLIDARAKLAQRVRGLERDAGEFRAGVSRLVAGFAPELSDLSPETAAKRLNERLGVARGHATLRAETVRRRDDARQAAEAAGRAASEATAALTAVAAALPPDAEPRALLARVAECDRLRAALEERRERLFERGETADETVLMGELETFDRDAAPAEIERLEAEERRVELEGQHVYAELAAARGRRDALGGAKAEAAAAEQRAAGAAMYAMAREWAVLKLAGLLLASAVERARAADRSPVLDRAAALFATLTGGGFSGFSEVYEKESPTLMGRRASGESVALRGMSEGTRDQFYLALRLAFLEDYAARAEAPPFIGDDLMASFDDARTAHGLKALAEIGDKVQPILFTHHRSVVDIARATLGGTVDVVEL